MENNNKQDQESNILSFYYLKILCIIITISCGSPSSRSSCVPSFFPKLCPINTIAHMCVSTHIESIQFISYVHLSYVQLGLDNLCGQSSLEKSVSASRSRYNHPQFFIQEWAFEGLLFPPLHFNWYCHYEGLIQKTIFLRVHGLIFLAYLRDSIISQFTSQSSGCYNLSTPLCYDFP